VTRIASELRSREAEVSRLERRAALNDKLASLSTLAAGAAHELGTPLSTIALVAKELESSAQRDGSSPALLEDARLIRAEVDRCRAILHQLSADAGQAVGELPEVLSLETLRTRLGDSLTADDQKRVVMEVGGDSEALEIPSRTVVQVVRNLVRNALDASQSPVKVTMAATSSLVIKVDDRGTGMTPEVLAKAGEPFYTTKPQGKGLGLGLFLARAVAERMGGSLQLQSEPGTGTSARIELPLRPLEHRPS
jgi:two-component system sensor histidine kinase RegB